MPTVWELARRSEEHMKGMVLPGTMFEEMGFNYIGPVDGHDLKALVTTLKNIKKLKGPQFLHVVTRKGKGYAPAEADPIKWHGPGPFDPTSGTIFKEKSQGPTYSQVFGQWLCDIAAADPKIVAITPAMREGSGLVEYSKRFPERYFDVAIAEQHAVTLAAGLAAAGMKPVVAIYSTFLQRGYDQLIHDVALQNLPVTFAIDRAGMVGSDGATHQGSFDLSFLRCIPNMVLMAPADEDECRQMLYTATTVKGPAAVRYPRGTGPGTPLVPKMTALPIGRAEIRRQGRSGLALIAVGSLVAPAQKIAERLDATLVNLRFIKPLDEDLLLQIAQRHSAIVTLEENVVAGGAGSAIGELLAAPGPPALLAAYRHSGPLHRARFTRGLPEPRRPRRRLPYLDHRRLVGTAFGHACPLGWQAVAVNSKVVAQAVGVEDVQGRADTRRIPINRVGIKDITHPVRVKDRASGEQHTIATFNMYVNLPHDFKGTHMSRFVSILNQP